MGNSDGRSSGGLRERKKRKLRQAIQHHALRLIAEQGYEATTVEQIAEAAEVSPSTFFRYFPTKEDVVLQDDYDPLWIEALMARPADEPIMLAVSNAFADSLGRVFEQDRDEILARSRLVFATPALRNRTVQGTLDNTKLIADVLARRTGRPTGDFEIQVLAGACIGMITVAFVRWVESDGREDLIGLLQRGIAAIGTSFQPPTPVPADRRTGT